MPCGTRKDHISMQKLENEQKDALMQGLLNTLYGGVRLCHQGLPKVVSHDRNELKTEYWDANYQPRVHVHALEVEYE